MRKLLAFILSLAMILTGFSKNGFALESDKLESNHSSVQDELDEYASTLEFSGLDDAKLRSYMEDSVYLSLIDQLDSDKYVIENIESRYLSKEYLDELEYNSKENIYFGYSLSELEQQFDGDKFIFTLGEDKTTVVKKFEEYDDTFDKVVKNVAIGTGVILFCVTVSTVTVGVAPAVSMVFAFSAKSATVCALSGGVISGVSAGVVTGIQTGDFNEAIKDAVKYGSDGFKWGAFTGAVSGGATELWGLKTATSGGLTLNEVATIQRESKYPLKLIKNFHSMEEYQIFKDAGLNSQIVNGKIAIVQDVDWNQVDDMGRTNIQRVHEELAPVDSKGNAFELHHVGQTDDSPLAVLTKEQHRGEGNFSKLHQFLKKGQGVDHGPAWDKTRKEFWNAMLKEAGY